MQQKCFYVSQLEELVMSAEMGSRFRGEASYYLTFSRKIVNTISNMKKKSHYDNELSKKLSTRIWLNTRKSLLYI